MEIGNVNVASPGCGAHFLTAADAPAACTRFVTSAGRKRENVLISNRGKAIRIIGEPFRDHVDNIALALHVPLNNEHARREDDAALLFVKLGPYDEVRDAGFIFDRDEHDALGGTGLLTDKDDPGGLHAPAVLHSFRLSAANDAGAL